MLVLIVEDEARVARTYRRVLEADGHEVTAATTCREALEVIRDAGELEQQIDVVLLDLSLPDGSGEELLGPLSVHQPDARIAVVSGCLDAEKILELVPYAAVSIPKPLSASTLVKLIQMLRRCPDAATMCQAFAEACRLSTRESQVLRCAVLGLSGSQSAEELGCSEGTLSTYWQRIFKKTGLRSQRDVIAAALQRGCCDHAAVPNQHSLPVASRPH